MELQEFGAELRQMRKDMHMTQEKLAEKLNVAPEDISRYEKGHREMGAIIYSRLLKLHDEVIRKNDNELLAQIQKLSPERREAVLQIIAVMKE